MKVGAEPKKVAILGVLGVAAVYLFYSNIIAPSSDIPPQARRPAGKAASTGALAIAQQAATPAPTRTGQPPRRRSTRDTVREWTPTLKPRRPEDRPDPTKVDPTLRLDLLAKLQTVTYTGGGERSLFDFSAAPPPKVPDIKILPKKGAPGQPGAPGAESAKTAAEAPTAVAPVKPKAPPVPLKFYGFISNRDGRRGFFINGDEIFAVSEGQVVQSRYKIVRIGLNSAVISDTQFEGHQQTVPLEEPPAGT
ncbi:MAG: hypothetical protein JNN08_22730 [Bryobacterales bacterium]|nr:hypothetical protein [Bryobacterales bacterium]